MLAKHESTSTPVPAGIEPAICISVIDLGTHVGEYKGKQKKQHKVAISFELPNVLFEDGDKAGQPRVIGGWWTLSLFDKAELRKMLESWRGQAFTDAEVRTGFDLRKLLGKPCQVQIIHKDGKARINNVLPFPKNTPIPQATYNNTYFSLAEFDDNVFSSLPEGIKTKITESLEWKELNAGKPSSSPQPTAEQRTQAAGVDDFDDDLPF